MFFKSSTISKLIMPPFQKAIQRIIPLIIASESIFSVVIMAICLAIYFKTEELEEISQHRGIRYFRLTFLFFSISYFFKFITRMLAFGFYPTSVVYLVEIIPSAISLSLSIYASIMAFFYFVYSISRKERGKHLEWAWHVLGITTGIFTVILSDILPFLAIQIILMLYAGHNMLTRKKKTKLYVVYLTLLAVWILSIAEIFIPNLLLEIQAAIYLLSASLFSIILFKVMGLTSV